MGERMAVAVEEKGGHGVMVEGDSMLIFFVAVLEVQVLVANCFWIQAPTAPEREFGART
jgi:hypothetical protein